MDLFTLLKRNSDFEKVKIDEAESEELKAMYDFLKSELVKSKIAKKASTEPVLTFSLEKETQDE